MPPQQFEVLLSEDVRQQLRSAVAQAADRGQKDEALQASRKITDGLRWIADELGESRYRLKVMGELRVVIIGPIGAVYAVDINRHLVHVGRIRLLGLDRGPAHSGN